MKTEETTMWGVICNDPDTNKWKRWTEMSEDEKTIHAIRIEEDNYYIHENKFNIPLVAEQIEIDLEERPEYYCILCDDIAKTARELAEIIASDENEED